MKSSRQRRQKHVARRSQKKTRDGQRQGRMFFLLFLTTCLFCILIVRLYSLQVLNSNKMAKMALRQMSRNDVIQPDRGLILDRNGKKLAVNVSTATVILNKNAFIKDGSLDEEALDKSLERVAGLLHQSKTKLLKKVKEEKKMEVDLAKDVDRSLTLRIQNADIQGILTKDKEKRFYPANNLASHVIGFMNEEGYGIYGVEKYYNDQLAGMLGKRVGLKDAKNQSLTMKREEKNLPTQGLNIRLTLDENIQSIVEDQAKKAKKESEARAVHALVQDVDTGEMLAMTNQSDYNLNFPKKAQDQTQEKDWESLSSEEKTKQWFANWRNFCVNDIYEPGSTFKTITAAAALEEGTTKRDRHYYCSGYIRDVKGGPIRCSSLPNPHGEISMEKAYALSCNTSFVKIGRELGNDRMNRYIRAFGFGEKTGIDLPGEEEGMIPEDLNNVSGLQQATVSFGHGIATTPVQMINAISAVANGGKLMVPHVLKEIDTVDNKPVQVYKPRVRRQVISKETSEEMMSLMEKVVTEGSGTRAQVPGYRIGGKTGTANKVSTEGGYEEGRYISSFVAVAPIDKPKYVILLIVEEPEKGYYGGAVAAPYAGKIMGDILEYEGFEKDTSLIEEEKTQEVEVPDVTNMLLEDAGKLLSEKGLKFNTEYTGLTDFSLVTDQSPKAGTMVAQGSIVDVYLDPNASNTKTMPTLLGKTVEEVKEILDPLDAQYNIHGSGELVKQVPQPGTVISWKKTMDLYFEEALNKKDQDKDEETKSQAREEGQEKKSKKKDQKTNKRQEGRKEEEE